MRTDSKNTFFDEAKRKLYKEDFAEEFKAFDVGIIGKSILGRDIDYYKIGSGKRHILLVGAHHSMEYITESVLYDFIVFLANNATRGGTVFGIDIKLLLQKFTYWVVPCLNPDGVELCLHGTGRNPLRERQVRMNLDEDDFSKWQANARGVDLNHNYDAGFFEYKRRYEVTEEISAGRTRYSGEYPESEPETRALAGFVRTVLPSLILTFHSQGELIYYQPHNKRTSRIAERCSHLIGYKVSSPENHALYGGLSDYAGGVLGIPSLTIEVGRGENPIDFAQLNSILSRMRNMLVLLPLGI